MKSKVTTAGNASPGAWMITQKRQGKTIVPVDPAVIACKIDNVVFEGY